MEWLTKLYEVLVFDKQKALVAFIVAAVGTYAVSHGINLDMSLRDALQALLVGVIAHGSVYFKRNQ